MAIILSGLFSAQAAEMPPIPEQWTTATAVRFALANNPDTAIIQQRLVMAQAAVQGAQAAFLPRLDLGASYQQTNTPMYSFGNILNQGVFSPNIDFNDPGRTDNLNVNARLSYRFYNGGRDQAGLAAAQAAHDASQFAMAEVRSQLAFAVVKTFFTIIQAEETVQARQSALTAITASVAVAQARQEAGDLLRADLLNLEVHQSEAHEYLIQAQHGAKLAKQAFLNLLGLHQGQVIIAPNCGLEPEIPTDFSFTARPELQRMAASLSSAKAARRQAQGGYYPTADAFAGYQLDQGYVFAGNGNSWQAGVMVNLNLFAGHQTESQVAAAQAKVRQVQEQQRKLSLAIGLEVEKARLALEQAEQRLAVTEKMVEQATESAELSRARFKEGDILSSDLIGVENRLTDALVHKTLAQASRRIAIADLRRALGLDLVAKADESAGQHRVPCSNTISRN